MDWSLQLSQFSLSKQIFLHQGPANRMVEISVFLKSFDGQSPVHLVELSVPVDQGRWLCISTTLLPSNESVPLQGSNRGKKVWLTRASQISFSPPAPIAPSQACRHLRPWLLVQSLDNEIRAPHFYSSGIHTTYPLASHPLFSEESQNPALVPWTQRVDLRSNQWYRKDLA